MQIARIMTLSGFECRHTRRHGGLGLARETRTVPRYLRREAKSTLLVARVGGKSVYLLLPLQLAVCWV
jgi:hypothetical protein